MRLSKETLYRMMVWDRLKGCWEKGQLHCFLLNLSCLVLVKCWCPQTPVEMGEKVLDALLRNLKPA